MHTILAGREFINVRYNTMSSGAIIVDKSGGYIEGLQLCGLLSISYV